MRLLRRMMAGILLFLATFPAQTPALADEGEQYFLPEFQWLRTDARFESVDSIRVQIHPHLNNYPPHGKDADPTRAVLESTSECRVYDASHSLVSTGRSVALIASNLTEPRFIECGAPARLIRAGKKTGSLYVGTLEARRIQSASAPGAWLLQIIDHLTLDQYLKGVVPVEIPAYWPDETLKAQAVAARTYAAFHVSLARESVRKRAYDVDDTVQYQAFTGVTDSDPRSDRAVDATSGLVLTYEKKLIQAFFSADSGGHTESAKDAWYLPANAGYCVAKPELYTDAEIDLKRWGPWTAKMMPAALAKLAPDLSDVARVEVTARTASGRARWLTLSSGRGAIKKVSGNSFRQALGLKSTMIWINPGEKLVHGRGFGHGVGMSQMGAMTLASKRGFTFRQILGFYFTGVEIVTTSSSPDFSGNN